MRCVDCAYMRTMTDESKTGLPVRMYDVCTRRHRYLPDNKQHVVNRDYWHECPHYLPRERTGGYIHGRVRPERLKDPGFELMSYTSDIRKILSDNSVKDMEEKEEKEWCEKLQEIFNEEV